MILQTIKSTTLAIVIKSSAKILWFVTFIKVLLKISNTLLQLNLLVFLTEIFENQFNFDIFHSYKKKRKYFDWKKRRILWGKTFQRLRMKTFFAFFMFICKVCYFSLTLESFFSGIQIQHRKSHRVIRFYNGKDMTRNTRNTY